MRFRVRYLFVSRFLSLFFRGLVVRTEKLARGGQRHEISVCVSVCAKNHVTIRFMDARVSFRNSFKAIKLSLDM